MSFFNRDEILQLAGEKEAEDTKALKVELEVELKNIKAQLVAGFGSSEEHCNVLISPRIYSDERKLGLIENQLRKAGFGVTRVHFFSVQAAMDNPPPRLRVYRSEGAKQTAFEREMYTAREKSPE